MSKPGQRFRVIKGGQKRPEDQHIPGDVTTILAQLQQFHDIIEQASTPIQGRIDDLITDWDTRPASFWQELLSELKTLREAVQPAISYSLCGKDEVATGFIAIRYSLMISIGHVGTLIDRAGIEVTSYHAVCKSRRVLHLQRRQYILQMLRELFQEVQKALGFLGKPGQKQCVDEYRRHQKELTTLQEPFASTRAGIPHKKRRRWSERH